jgi:hypothetical protein
MKIFYFIAGLGDVILVLIGEIFVFSLQYNFIWRSLYNVYFMVLGKLALTYELYTWVLLEIERFLKFVVLLEDEDTLFLKRCIIHFI